MISAFCLVFTIWTLSGHAKSLQSGYTCETSVKLTCPQLQKIVILEVIYSSECPKVDDIINGTAIYAPSRCIGYHRERTSTLCNGQTSCTVENKAEQRPSFLIGKEANCGFKGQSINIEYSCVPDFTLNALPRIDICSSQSVDDVKEGFIHTPEYPLSYPNSVICSKTIPAPKNGQRLKIFAVKFDLESVSIARLTGLAHINDWVEINDNGEKIFGDRAPFTLLFDDVIEASLKFKSDMANSKRLHNGFLLYFIVTPVRRSRPTATTKPLLTTAVKHESTSIVQQKVASLLGENRRDGNVGLILLVVVLSSALVILVGAVLLYKRRSDRRIRYLSETLSSFLSRPSKPVRSVAQEPSDNSDVSKLSLQQKSSSTTQDEKLSIKDSSKIIQDSDHIYSEDPLELKNFLQSEDANALLYESIDYATIKPVDK